MRTVTYKSVEERANVLFSGKLRPTREDAAVLNVLINSRYREYFESYFWKEWTVVERRRFRPEYVAADTYVAGEEVYFAGPGAYYLALRSVPIDEYPATQSGSDWELNVDYWAESQADYTGDDWDSATDYEPGDVVFQPLDGTYYQAHTANTNQEPPDAAYWGELVAFERSIDLEGGNQEDATAIGEIKAVWPKNPRTHENLERQLFELTDTSLLVRGSLSEVWVEFRLRPNAFTGDVWASGAFSVGDQVYYNTTGEYYVCIAGATTEVPTDTTKWEKLDFPYILKDCVAQAAFADMLKATGKQSKFAVELQEARRLLQREFDKLERQQGQVSQLNVMVRT